ncbi:MAG: molybdopterin-dependent oxidoreductase [Candidatus Latescibacteria bacterium]|nr:molybdopterin-dependent oxidoreductase [Candidatus Latescibacterota bacterium]
MVHKPLHPTLAELRAMPKQTQITKHCCIQGWSGIAEWGGVPLRHIIELCQPLPSARYVVFYGFDDKSTSEPHLRVRGATTERSEWNWQCILRQSWPMK